MFIFLSTKVCLWILFGIVCFSLFFWMLTYIVASYFVYTKTLRIKAKEVAKNLGIDMKEGIYCAMTGPTYETPAEVRMQRLLGANAVGMSTIPEAIIANWCGINVLGISCLTNYACGVLDQPLNHQEVIDTANRVKADFKKLLFELVKVV